MCYVSRVRFPFAFPQLHCGGTEQTDGPYSISNTVHEKILILVSLAVG